MARYHDEEWGVPEHDDTRLFEILCLEGAQAGLSWRTILYKREGFRKNLAGFVPERVAELTEADIAQALTDPGIVRHRGKLEAFVNNAQRLLELRGEGTSFDAYVWGFVDGAPVRPAGGVASLDAIPATTSASDALAKDLKRRGFRFVGPTTVYAFMQAAGLVNDHTNDCFRA